MKKGAILCVDDEPIILLSLVQELKRTFGGELEYEQAMNAEAALKTIEDLEAEGVRVILIISDWLMPGIKGDKFLEIVHERYPGIRAIMITGKREPRRQGRLRQAGVASRGIHQALGPRQAGRGDTRRTGQLEARL